MLLPKYENTKKGAIAFYLIQPYREKATASYYFVKSNVLLTKGFR